MVLLGGQGVWYPTPVLPLGLAPPPPPPPPPPPSPPSLGFATFEAHSDSNAAASASHTTNNNAVEEAEGLPPEIMPALDMVGEVEVGVGRAPREQRRAVLRAELKDRIGVDTERSVLGY